MPVRNELWFRFEGALKDRDATGRAVADAVDDDRGDAEIARRLTRYREAKQEVVRLLEVMDAEDAEAVAYQKKMPPAVAPAEGVEKPNN